MAGKISETETVIKNIIPYLVRRGYDVVSDFTFEYPTPGSTRANLGFVDILVKQGGKIAFLVEAKRFGKTLADKDRAQAVAYGRDCKAPFVILTNGNQFESLNALTGKRIRWSGKFTDKVPSKAELPKALKAMHGDPHASEVMLANDNSLPFRPGLSLKQLNALFARCHNVIRKIEKNEDHAFSDFAKLLFLKLIEEKADSEGTQLPYSYRFYELAAISEDSSDQVKSAILSMLDTVRKSTPYGDVIQENIYLKNSKTFKKIVSELAGVYFGDSRTDSKGAAFEYFVRVTLKGKRLGQYFTPRPLIELMQGLIGREKILTTLSLSGDMRVVDPACGTGGFLVFLMLASLDHARALHASGKLNEARLIELEGKIRRKVFFGADAHEGVASSAKMNMIIAGDGHSNIQCENSLSRTATLWNVAEPNIDLIITNPPFGTAEGDSIEQTDSTQFPIKGSKGQMLFLQKMVQTVKPGGEICTVIDEGLLNTDQAADLRQYIMENMIIRGIVRLPDTTFKPNKINVKSSILHLVKRQTAVVDLEDDYPVLFVDIESLGYLGSGEPIRNFDYESIVDAISAGYHGPLRSSAVHGAARQGWRWFVRSSVDIAEDQTKRFDLKYWDSAVSSKIDEIRQQGGLPLKEINRVKTRRGKSPAASAYVDEADGYALVIKAGSNITRGGTVVRLGDFIEKAVFDDLKAVAVENGDILLSSTGDGTLGKCAVYRDSSPAIFDGHVALIRVDQKLYWPEFICDYLRSGFGAEQVARLFTGSTGLIELPPEKVDTVVIPKLSIPQQKAFSDKLRLAETAYENAVSDASSKLNDALQTFRTS